MLCASPMRIHFTGVGGVGMSGLAHICADLGHRVSGTDQVDSEFLEALACRGLRVAAGHDPAFLDDVDVVVFSAAIPPGNPERKVAEARGLRTLSRGAFLAEISTAFACVIGVAGSHGKTTTSAMLAHVLECAGRSPGFLVGGTIPGWTRNARAGAGEILVTEVDESDGTQALMAPTWGVVLNVDDDHCWSLGGTAALDLCFATFAGRSENVVAGDDAGCRRVLGEGGGVRYVSARDLPPDLCLPVPGEHNRANAAAARAVARAVGIEESVIRHGLTSFPGVTRRMTVRHVGMDGGWVLVEDYAHHPTELAATMEALRETYPDHDLHVLFQPHRFGRIRRYGRQFSACLSGADAAVVTRPFAAWLDDAGGDDPARIAAGVDGEHVPYWQGDLPAHAAEYAAGLPEGSTVVAVCGAGDISQTVPPIASVMARRERALLAEDLQAAFPDLVLTPEQPWRQLTSLGVGDGCPLCAHPADETQLAALCRHLTRRSIDVLVLGEGTDLVGTDTEPVRVVIRLNHMTRLDWSRDACTLRTDAGVALPALVRRARSLRNADARLGPLGWIPGSVGGALVGNAGADGITIGELVQRVYGVTRSGETWSCDGADIEWAYRSSSVPQDVVVTAADLALQPSPAGALEQQWQTAGVRRRDRQPVGVRSAGCVFRNPVGDSAGHLLDTCSAKGMRVGGAVVSSCHANVMVNDGNARENDVVELTRRLQRLAYAEAACILRPEIRFCGVESHRKIVLQQRILADEAARNGDPSAPRKPKGPTQREEPANG